MRITRELRENKITKPAAIRVFRGKINFQINGETDMKIKNFFLMFFAIIGISCGDDPVPTDPTYDELIAQGWNTFIQGDYDGASAIFDQASVLDASLAEAYNGKGWCGLRSDELPAAASDFSSAAGKSGRSAAVFAGWAFVLNAQKSYAASNTQADSALARDPNWEFEHGLPYDAEYVHLVKAQNYFALLNYASSLAEVQILNVSFSADVNTVDGRAALAAEIERLRTTLSKK